MNARDFDGVDVGDSDLALAPQRTSVLAILSLICAIICLIPGLGLLAVVFGISALVGINSSRGRVGGTGLAVAGLVLGLIVSLAQVAICVGMLQAANFFGKQFFQPVNQSITALDAGDYKTTRLLFDAKAGAAITDEQFQKFRTAYQAEMGAFKGVPTGFAELIQAYAQAGHLMKSVQGRNDFMPVPVSFDKGMGILLLQLDQQAMRGSRGGSPPNNPMNELHVKNLILLTPAGNTVELAPSGLSPGQSPSAAPTGPPDATPPSEPDKGGGN